MERNQLRITNDERRIKGSRLSGVKSTCRYFISQFPGIVVGAMAAALLWNIWQCIQ